MKVIINDNPKVGDLCLSKNYGDFEILEILENKKVKIRFTKTGNVYEKGYYDIKYGEVSDNKSDTHGIVGNIYTSSNDGDFEVLNFEGKDKNGCFLYTIKFLNTENIYYNILKSNIIKKSVSDNIIHEFYIGQKLKTNQGDIIKILDGPFRLIRGGKIRQIYKIQSINYPDFISEYSRDDILSGNIYNPLIPLVTKGFHGIGEYLKQNYQKEYTIWNGILRRKDIDKYKNSTAYQDVEVAEEFLNFQNFCKWYVEEKELYNKEYQNDLECDKDFIYLIKKLDRRVYSTETCLLIPSEINGYIINIYSKFNLNFQSKYKVEFPRENWGYYRIYDTQEEALKYFLKEKDYGFKKLLQRYKNILPEKYYNILIKFNYKNTYNWIHNTNY